MAQSAMTVECEWFIYLFNSTIMFVIWFLKNKCCENEHKIQNRMILVKY